MLTQKQKDDWVAALRSGNFKQGTGRLNDGKGGFCCLGVLCEVLGKEKFETGITFYSIAYVFDEKNKAKHSSNIPESVLDNPNLQHILVTMNDGGQGFLEIAEFIEKELVTQG